MLDSLQYRRGSKAWQKRSDTLTLKAGDAAPDFELGDVNGKNPVRISGFHGQKPMEFIFDSYTCLPYIRGTVNLHDLYLQYRNPVQFLMIRFREAHPLDEWRIGEGITG